MPDPIEGFSVFKKMAAVFIFIGVNADIVYWICQLEGRRMP